ncbi:hypothetical protein ING2E5B_0245 [Fermentimonas caenicola]|jgi:hypothetical protein|uniref:Uncharacterized protein n=1 Tax=Fermentimonas caenicola TaxID=1562970 RepID=A0A098BWH7_9BACT|nr:hypothetical protein ING2E5B_0245 [Fermentimonas caenicola]
MRRTSLLENSTNGVDESIEINENKSNKTLN